jgi:hypothetical protein
MDKYVVPKLKLSTPCTRIEAFNMQRSLDPVCSDVLSKGRIAIFNAWLSLTLQLGQAWMLALYEWSIASMSLHLETPA